MLSMKRDRCNARHPMLLPTLAGIGDSRPAWTLDTHISMHCTGNTVIGQACDASSLHSRVGMQLPCPRLYGYRNSTAIIKLASTFPLAGIKSFLLGVIDSSPAPC